MATPVPFILYFCFVLNIAHHRDLFGSKLTGINFEKYDDIPVKPTGEDCPESINSFSDCKFSDIINENIKVGVVCRIYYCGMIALWSVGFVVVYIKVYILSKVWYIYCLRCGIYIV